MYNTQENRFAEVLGNSSASLNKMQTEASKWSWESGEVPVDWKLANVPVFKKGKKEDLGNYRPVSLILVPRKFMEKVILEVKHLGDNRVVSYSQHGFKRGTPCVTNLISFYNKVTHLVDQGKPVDVGFFGF